MGAIIAMGIKGADGNYYNYTISIYDTPDQYGNNVAMWVEQTPEQRQNKVQKQYVGNGKVIWTDEKICLAGKKPQPNTQLPSPPANNFNNQPKQNFNTGSNYNNNQKQETTNKFENPNVDDFDFYNGTDDDLPPF